MEKVRPRVGQHIVTAMAERVEQAVVALRAAIVIQTRTHMIRVVANTRHIYTTSSSSRGHSNRHSTKSEIKEKSTDLINDNITSIKNIVICKNTAGPSIRPTVTG